MSIHKDVSITRKRTHNESEVCEIDTRPFVIQDSSTPFARPRTFTPICLLSRTQLPLAFLDTMSFGSRLFSAHVHVLEASYEHGYYGSLLVAKERDGSRLYAIERVKQKCYAICRLGNWVTESILKERSTLVLHYEEDQTKRQALQSTDGGTPWWKPAAVDVPKANTSETGCGLDLPKLAMQRIMDAPQKTSKIAEPVEEQATAHMETQEMPTPHILSEEIQVSSQDVLKDLTKQYLDALYLSRTSLAYFTKGPLSRARAAFTLEDSAKEVATLVQFLRESIISSTSLDKKYKDKITEIVKEMPLANMESPEQHSEKPSKKKARKWKPKRDKDGLYTNEREFVEQWWRLEDESESSSSPVETLEDSIRRRIVRVRNRETFLQIILVLEVLALEVAISVQVEAGVEVNEAQDHRTPQKESQEVSDLKKVKRKKTQDLPALLEILLDKLCIWHSLQSHSPVKKAKTQEQDTSDETNDDLKAFCIEVILPFYSSRIPKDANVVNKKLGGPTAPTPIQRNTAGARKPGEPATRYPPEKKPRKPLARVATETLNRPLKLSLDQPPSLQRSVTDSETGLRIKREGSEISMDSVPPAQSAFGHSRHASLVPQLKAFSKREVDLSAMSAANEAKVKKKKDVEAKLKEAVEMLKKPNRKLAVKEIEERTDKRFAKAMAKTKTTSRFSAGKDKAATTGKERTVGSVHVTATPKRVRAVNTTPRKHLETAHPQVVKSGSSGMTHVPSTSARLVNTESFNLPPASTPAIPQTGHRPRNALSRANIQETPSRGFAKFMPPGLASQPGTLESPSAKGLPSLLQATPSKTSISRLARPLVAASPNALPMRKSENAGRSIYDALGWDDDGYEELE